VSTDNSMGGGASKGKVTLEQEREDNEFAERLFDKLNGDNEALEKGATITLMELYSGVNEEKIDWDLEGPGGIKETLKMFDKDGDGKLDIYEFKAALAAMEVKEMKKKKKKTRSSTAGKGDGLKRGWTFRGHREAASAAEETEKQKKADEAAAKAKAAADAKAADEKAKKETTAAVLKGDIFNESTPAERQKEYWAQTEPQAVWTVKLGQKMPWHSTHEDALTEAMSHARGMGKTPLLLDGSKDRDGDGLTKLDDVFLGKPEDGGRAAVLLEARQMTVDVKEGTRTRDLIMKEARKSLVEAMKGGKEFYVRLQDKATEFTGAGFSGDDTLPLKIFDARHIQTAVKQHTDADGTYKCLAEYVAGSVACAERNAYDTLSHGLWESEHILAPTLREGDLDYDGNFFVAEGFGVVVCAQLGIDEYKSVITTTLPLMRFQPIFVRASVL